jgi:putative SOS response-associated peptidase YedK
MREPTFFKWGLVSNWAKDAAVGKKLINARSENVTEKPPFHGGFARIRCLVPSDGFFEWSQRGDRKRPFYFYMSDGEPFAIAGLWSIGKAKECLWRPVRCLRLR